MIIPLVTAAVIATSGQAPDHFDLAPRSINFEKPTAGAWDDQIVAASKVPKKWRPFARCVLDRESGGTLRKIQSGAGAKNPRSSASGRWQFLDSQWRPGLAHMVRQRLVDYGVPKSHAKKVRMHLQSKPINKWHGRWQDIGFIAVVTSGGAHHWNGPGCGGKRP